eukprot:COSAG01_NODE_20839_length_932_cov_1.731092_2_plen_59_part_00
MKTFATKARLRRGLPATTCDAVMSLLQLILAAWASIFSARGSFDASLIGSVVHTPRDT